MSAVTIVNGSRATAREEAQRAKAKEQKHQLHIPQSYTFGGIPYNGLYEVTPTPYEQMLETAHRTLAEDVTVHQIPYLATSNESGGITVSIAS